MNKFLACVLFAFVAVSVAQDASEDNQVVVSDERETADIKQVELKPLCLAARDQAKAFLTDSSNSVAQKLYTKVMNLGLETGDEAVASSRSHADKAAARLRDEPVATNLRGLFRQVMGDTFNGVKDHMREVVQEKIEELKSELNINNFTETLNQVCTYVKAKQSELEKNFNKEKDQIVKETKDADLKASIKSVKVSNLGCLTFRRLNQVKFACNVALSLGAALDSAMPSK